EQPRRNPPQRIVAQRLFLERQPQRLGQREHLIIVPPVRPEQRPHFFFRGHFTQSPRCLRCRSQKCPRKKPRVTLWPSRQIMRTAPYVRNCRLVQARWKGGLA